MMHMQYLGRQAQTGFKKLEELPLNRVQKVLDRFYSIHIQPIADVKALNTLNAWIDRDGEGSRIQRIGDYLLKLPIRAARNNLRLIESILNIAFYLLVHPVSAARRTGQSMKHFVISLKQPETFVQMGASGIGTSLGQILISGALPPAFVGLGLGAAVLVAGFAFGAFKAAAQAQKGSNLNEVKREWKKSLPALPELMLSGFFLGLTFGGIQKSIQKRSIQPVKVTTVAKAEKYLKNEFVPKNRLSIPTTVSVDANTGRIFLKWEGEQLKKLVEAEGRGVVPSQYHRLILSNPRAAPPLHMEIIHPEAVPKYIYNRYNVYDKYLGNTGGWEGYGKVPGWYHYPTKTVISGPNFTTPALGLSAGEKVRKSGQYQSKDLLKFFFKPRKFQLTFCLPQLSWV